MTILLTAGPNDRQAMLDSLDLDAAEFLGGALKERVTVRNPNGGVRTEVREILVEDTRLPVLEQPGQGTTG